MDIKCTGNNDNGCFMHSPAINCGCEGLKEFGKKLKNNTNISEEAKKYAENTMRLKRQNCIEDIVNYFNAKYKNATIKYEDNNFIIEGDEKESLEIKEDIKDMLNFSHKKQ